METDLKKANALYEILPEDIQVHLKEEYILPQLRGDDLVKEFDKQLMSEECQRLGWQVLPDVVSKIIENNSAMKKIDEKYRNLDFRNSYERHFIKKINSFTHHSWTPLTSMCAELTMRQWH
jgi:hypothetical protein